MPAIPPYIIEPIWEQVADLLPERDVAHPLGCHRPRIPDWIIFDKLVQVLIFGCAYERIADATCSASTLRRRRDEWIAAGVMDQLQQSVLNAYDWLIGLELDDIAVDGCITKAPCGGQQAGKSPVDRGKQGLKRSTLVDANGIPIGAIAAPANHHDTRLLDGTLATLERLDSLPERIRTHLDRGYAGPSTKAILAARDLLPEVSQKGAPAPITATKRWVIERTNAWTNAHKKLVWCTERVGAVIDFWLAFSAAIVTVGRLIRQAWTRYRWKARPCRRP
jgi:transposase